MMYRFAASSDRLTDLKELTYILPVYLLHTVSQVLSAISITALYKTILNTLSILSLLD